jgi:hypothetical protein
MARSREIESDGALVLAERSNGGVRVRLLWSQSTNVVAVEVRDTGGDADFELLVEPDANALDVFQHPYAYAARPPYAPLADALGVI